MSTSPCTRSTNGEAGTPRFGWAGEKEAEAAEAALAGRFEPLPARLLAATAPGRAAAADGGVRLWEAVRAVLGADTPNTPQQTGDCVAFGAKNAIEYLQCVEILAGDPEGFRPVFPPYLYATGRVLEGGGRLRGRAGSLGGWQAAAVIEHGVLRADAPGLPAYAGRVADAWGDGRSVRVPGGDGGRGGHVSRGFREFRPLAVEHPVGSAARVRTWDEAVAAVAAGHPVTVASNAGFRMTPGRDGFHARSGRWPHQMCLVGICDDSATPWAALLNSWGDVHGRLRDFATGTDWPTGTLRVRREALEHMLRTGEAYAYAAFRGFPPRRIDWGKVAG